MKRTRKSKSHVGLFYSRIHRDEKLPLNEPRDRGHEATEINAWKEQFGLVESPESFDGLDVVVDRCLATSRSIYITRFLKSYRIPVASSYETADICADRTKNSLVLAGAGVLTLNTEVALTVDSAMDIVEESGYPCILKPVVDSWGRLMAKIDPELAAEAILEHKSTPGNYEHKVFYIQEFVEKPGRDICMLITDGEPAAAMVRSSDHWLTNTAKGASVDEFELDDRAKGLVKQASDAVGGGLLGVDLMETGNDYIVHEVNHTVEFRALNDTVGAGIPVTVVDWLEAKVDGVQPPAEVSA